MAEGIVHVEGQRGLQVHVDRVASLHVSGNCLARDLARDAPSCHLNALFMVTPTGWIMSVWPPGMDGHHVEIEELVLACCAELSLVCRSTQSNKRRITRCRAGETAQMVETLHQWFGQDAICTFPLGGATRSPCVSCPAVEGDATRELRFVSPTCVPACCAELIACANTEVRAMSHLPSALLSVM